MFLNLTRSFTMMAMTPPRGRATAAPDHDPRGKGAREPMRRLLRGALLSALLLAPAVSAQQIVRSWAPGDGFQGRGAALCVAAGEVLERDGG
ncbi:MAG TPA: hypothetical protein VF665_18890, partial [Longimicrobium sp.]|uniref:hypothetical protein n=1 Tax=Longimicrobium sp. TaxID=2029185 RepID=UPI002ED8514D